MPKKSNNLFAILVIPLSIMRDSKLSSILGDSKIEYVDKKYIGGGGNYGIYFTGDFSYVKTWKTESGANKYLETVIKRSGSKYGVEPYTIEQDTTIDWVNVDYKVVHIEKEWNHHIEKEITDSINRHNKNIERLNKLKI